MDRNPGAKNGSGDNLPRGRGRGIRGPRPPVPAAVEPEPIQPPAPVQPVFLEPELTELPELPEPDVEEELVKGLKKTDVKGKRENSPDSEAGFRGTTRGVQIPVGGGGGDGAPKKEETEVKGKGDKRVKPPTRTKPEGMGDKKGSNGRPVELLCNFFALKELTGGILYEYLVEFEPEIDSVKVRRGIMFAQIPTLGIHMYHGMASLYCRKPLESPFVIKHPDKTDPAKIYTITLTYLGRLEGGDAQFRPFYDMLVKKIMHGLELTEQNGIHYDTASASQLTRHKLILYPGYKATLKCYEKSVLLNVDLKTKVIRMDSALDWINETMEKTRNSREKTEEKIVGSIVMTSYNKKTHKISRIAWELNPTSTFPTKNGPISYEAYYKSRYNIVIKDSKQPLLLAAPERPSFHKLQKVPEAPTDTYLIPELCNPTGLMDEQRANFSLMRDLAQYLHAGPEEKVNQLNAFMKRVRTNDVLKVYLKEWGVDFEPTVHGCAARELMADKLLFANGIEYPPEKPGDWSNAFRGSNKMISSKDLKHWVLIVTDRDAAGVDSLIPSMQKVAKPLGMTIGKPEIRKSSGNRANEYKDAITKAMKEGPWDLVMVILSNNNADTYAAVKTLLSVEQGQPSQCFLAKNTGAKGLMSIATKVVIQINAKLGGEPWGVKIPLKGLMVAGFDTYRGGKHTRGQAVGAMVATTKGDTFSTFYSCLNLHNSADELSRNVCCAMTKCLEAYQKVNGTLPEVILLYRDGVGDGNIDYVFSVELDQMHKSLKESYDKAGLPLPKFAFIIVTKGTSTKLFKPQGGKNNNPPPGTICDDTVTCAERYDFYLIPQTVRQGTVSPTSFNVISDTTGLPPDRMQRLTYKLCHLYYNYTGTVAVPAPCQYAHKLAMQTGTATGKQADETLAFKLHFL